MGCPEVVYGAYYPYLYGRAAPPSRAAATFASPFTAPHYDRFNVQSTQSLSQEVYGSSGGGGGGAGASAGGGGSGGSVSSGGGVSPAASPPRPHLRLRTKEEDLSLHGRASAEGAAEDEDDDGSCGGGGSGGSRAQYVSANCVVFTHYSGDVATVVDEHFTRALGCDKSGSGSTKETSPMSSRNFPASFWNSQYQPTAGATTVPDLYGEPHAHAHPYHPHAAHAAHAHDPWASHYQQYTAAAHHHRAVHEYHHHHNTMAQYGGLLLPTRLPHHAQYKPPVDWSTSHTSRLHEQAASAHHGHAHALDTAAYSSYPTMAGLEAQVQESSKDLYWF